MNVDALLSGFGTAFSLWVSILLVGVAIRYARRLLS